MVFRMIHVKDSLLPRGKVWSLDFLGKSILHYLISHRSGFSEPSTEAFAMRFPIVKSFSEAPFFRPGNPNLNLHLPLASWVGGYIDSLQLSNEKWAPGYLLYIVDYTTQLYRDYNKPL